MSRRPAFGPRLNAEDTDVDDITLDIFVIKLVVIV